MAMFSAVSSHAGPSASLAGQALRLVVVEAGPDFMAHFVNNFGCAVMRTLNFKKNLNGLSRLRPYPSNKLNDYNLTGSRLPRFTRASRWPRTSSQLLSFMSKTQTGFGLKLLILIQAALQDHLL